MNEESQKQKAREVIELIQKIDINMQADFDISIEKSPKQTNNFDCGLFMIKTLERECLGQENFSLENLSSLNLRLTTCIQLFESKINLKE